MYIFYNVLETQAHLYKGCLFFSYPETWVVTSKVSHIKTCIDLFTVVIYLLVTGLLWLK